MSDGVREKNKVPKEGKCYPEEGWFEILSSIERKFLLRGYI